MSSAAVPDWIRHGRMDASFVHGVHGVHMGPARVQMRTPSRRRSGDRVGPGPAEQAVQAEPDQEDGGPASMTLSVIVAATRRSGSVNGDTAQTDWAPKPNPPRPDDKL